MIYEISQHSPRCAVGVGLCRLCILLLILTVLPGCGARPSEDANTPEQNFISSMNHLLSTSPEQAAQLEPVWTAYREAKDSLKTRLPNNSDAYLEALAKLHQDTVAKARPHLDAAQSTRLEEIFAEQRQMVTRSRATADRVAERDKTEGPITRPPSKESKEGGGMQMGNSGGGSTW